VSALVARDLSVSLGAREVLTGIDFAAAPGEVTGIIGPNGAGKSTLVKALLGLVPSRGEVLVEGQPLESLPRLSRAKTLSYLPQGAEVHWPLTGRALASLGRYPFAGRASDAAAVECALKDVDAVHLAGRNVFELSAGEKARVLLARALAVEALILLADEPVAALDPEHQLRVMGLLSRLAGRGRAVVVVLHDLNLACRFCRRLYLIHKGRVADSGPPEKVLTAANLKRVYRIRAHVGGRGSKKFVIPLAAL